MHRLSLVSWLRWMAWFAWASALGCSMEVGDSLGESQAAITAQPDRSCRYASYGGHDYWVCSGTRSWSAAQGVCSSVRMHLARPDDTAENNFLRAQLSGNAWIGGQDSATEGQWRWVNDSARFWNGGANGGAQGGLFTRWSSGEPNNFLNEDCTELRSNDGRWNDTQCGLSRAFICESDATTAQAPQAPGTACTLATRNGATYWMCSDDRSWDEARTRCQSIGMDLAVIDDLAEDSFVQARVTRDSHIGLTDRGDESAWRWVGSNALAWCGDGRGRAPAPAFSHWRSDLLVSHPVLDADCEYVERAGRAYWFCGDQRNWQSARAACEGVGMHLAHVNDRAEDDFISSHAFLGSWIGGTDGPAEGQWRWVDDNARFWSGNGGGAAVGGAYTHWNLTEPNNGAQSNCLVKQPLLGTWDDVACDTTNAWVCEGPVTTAPVVPDTADCALLAANDGKWLNARCDRAAGYVCESVSGAVDVDLDDLSSAVRNDAQRYAPHVTHVTFDTPVNAAQLFLSQDEALGARSCNDSFEPSARPPVDVPNLGLEAVEYEQRYRGVPVYGRGYVVHRDPATRAVEFVHGETDLSIDLDVEPTVSEGAAFQAAITSFGGNPFNYLLRASGRLMIVPSRQGRDPQWRLGWMFSIPPAGDDGGYAIAVSARDGSVLLSSPWNKQQCLSANVETASNPVDTALRVRTGLFVQNPTNPFVPYTPLISEFDVASATSVGQGCAACGGTCTGATCRCPNGVACLPAPIALYSDATPPTTYIECEDARYPRVAAVESLDVTSLNPDPDPFLPEAQGHRTAAAFYVAMQRCLDFVSSRDAQNAPLFEVTPGDEWRGFDGFGALPIAMRLQPDAPSSFFTPVDFSINVNSAYVGASIETACHEFGHAVWAWIETSKCAPNDLACQQGTYGSSPEAAAIEEAVGDIFGNAAEMRVRGYPGPAGPAPVSVPGGFCFGGDERHNNRCERNFAEPEASDLQEGDGSVSCYPSSNSAGTELYGICPRDYAGPDYCPFGRECEGGNAIDCCDAHSNSTVFSHWFYLVTVGGTGINQSSCGYEIEGCDPDLRVSTEQALRIVFHALRDQLTFSDSGFSGMKDATLTAARLLHGEDSRQYRSVANAWYAVNVAERPVGETGGDVSPARGARGVNPWVEFQWPADPADRNWELRIATTTLGGPGTYTLTTNELMLTPSNEVRAVARIALPPNDPQTYFWQARPVGGDAWDCLPIHWFKGTGAREDIQQFAPEARLAPDGKLLPGEGLMRLDQVPGAEEYVAFMATSERGCGPVQPNEAVLQGTAPHLRDRDTVAVMVPGIQPDTTYRLHVQARGPVRVFLNGNTAPVVGSADTGACLVRAVETGPMQPVEVSFPTDDRYFRYESPHTGGSGQLSWRWTDPNGANRWELAFYQQRPDGTCDTGTRTVRTIERSCGGRTCAVNVTDDFFPMPHPAGYCWEVVSIADNGGRSQASARRRFGYYIGWVEQTAPGVQAAYAEGVPGQAPDPGWLGDDSYGDAQTLQWEAYPNASSYIVKLGRWPWRYPVSPRDPSNCLGPTTYTCDSEPREVTYREEVTGLAAPVSAEDGGRGRYCWSVWPVLPGPVQPKVDIGTVYCYSTGPAEPDIEIVTPPNAGEFDGEPVEAEVTFPYLPLGGDVIVDGTNDYEIVSRSPECEVDVTNDPFAWTPDQAWIYPDLYDCKVRVRINTAESSNYTVRATAFGQSQNQTASEAFETASCGEQDAACCPGEECDETWLNCESGTCQCGEREQGCCGGNGGSCDANLACQGGVCVCGGRNQPCCNGSTGCGGGLECVGGTCQCGGVGQLCCGSNSCNGGLTCNTGSNRCETVEPCNSRVFPGGNTPESITVNLGLAAGRTRLVYATYNVPDILTFNDSNGARSTGCTSTDLFPLGAAQSCPLGVNGLTAPEAAGCCQVFRPDGSTYVECWQDITYTSSNGTVRVDVQPNCSGASDTAWEFMLTCGQP